MSLLPIPTYENPYPEEMPMGDMNQYFNDLGIGSLIDQIVIACIVLVVLMCVIPILMYVIKRYRKKHRRTLRFKHRDCDGKGCEGCQGYGYIELSEESWDVLMP